MSDSASDRPRIVVGVDGSDPSKAALRYAQQLAQAENARIDVIGAWAWPSALALTGMPVEYSPKDDIEKASAQAVDEVFGANPGTDVTVRAVEGGAAQALIDASRDAYMVVVGSRGLGGFMSMLLGSVSERVAAKAACPVLIIHAQ